MRETERRCEGTSYTLCCMLTTYNSTFRGLTLILKTEAGVNHVTKEERSAMRLGIVCCRDSSCSECLRWLLTLSPFTQQSRDNGQELDFPTTKNVASADAIKVAMPRFKKFEDKITKNDADGIFSLLTSTENAWWRDLLAMSLHI